MKYPNENYDASFIFSHIILVPWTIVCVCVCVCGCVCVCARDARYKIILSIHKKQGGVIIYYRAACSIHCADSEADKAISIESSCRQGLNI